MLIPMIVIDSADFKEVAGSIIQINVHVHGSWFDFCAGLEMSRSAPFCTKLEPCTRRYAILHRLDHVL